MKKIFMLLICGSSLCVPGEDLESIHCRNIETAIHGFAELFTNANQSASYDFFAILGEIKNLKQKKLKNDLVTKLIVPIFITPKDMWKHERKYFVQGDRVSFLVKAIRSLGEINLMLKWRKYTDLLISMKEELAFYADVKHPDAYRDRWIAEAKEELMEQIRKAGTNKNILIRGTVPLSKARREASAKWSYKRKLIYEIGEYVKNYFDSLVLMDDYRQLNTKEREQLIKMVREGLGRYPKWYQKELDEKLK